MCDDCKYVKYSFDGGSTKCGYHGKKDCNFIPRENKHQKTENERLLQKLQQAQSEAIYKLVKKFKNRIVNKYEYVQVGIFDELDNLVQEMTEVYE